ncbi:hypothetical protein HDU67_009464 [Dinochytrium kinnereticum]|nr:hypothetical protein HDU67_009464 [Dinochytrium kinnereticum]
MEGAVPNLDSSKSLRSSVSSKHYGDLEITDDIGFDDDDDDDEFLDRSLNHQRGSLGMNSLGIASPLSKGSLITTQKALMLRRVTFAGTGTEESRTRATFPDEWRGKGFVLNSQTPDLSYGLVQSRGGPCGLLAALQAYMLKYLLFGQDKTALKFKPNLRVQSKSDLSRERYIPDGITENMELHEFVDAVPLREFLAFNLDSFMNNDPYRHGLIQLLYSAVLSRGAETIREEDFDETGCSLIGRHAYCTQELVNLLLMGRAISNVHDGDIHLGGGAAGEDVKVLKGFKKTQQFGYLTLFEHYGSLKVGDYLKNPTLPIFVVCAESHFSILFSTDDRPLTKTNSTGGKASVPVRGFDLYYYDGLAGQDTEIRLAVRPSCDGKKADDGGDDKLTPPLELVIGTRWEGAEVEWHGSEPLL